MNINPKTRKKTLGIGSKERKSHQIDGHSRTNTNSNTDLRKFFIDVVAKYCDKCGTSYTLSDVRIVRDSDFSSIIHFSCQNCESNHIATFVKPMGMASRTPINTDLSIEEIAKFAKSEKISSQEVLELYDELENISSLSL